MRPGGWQMSLRAEAPQSIVSAIRDALATYDSTNERWTSVMDGQIVVFDTDLRDPSLERARYAGVLETQSGDRSFSGSGLASYMQTDDGLGYVNIGDTPYQAISESDLVAVFNELEFNFDMNGLTDGTAFSTLGAPVDITWQAGPLGMREMIDSAAVQLEQEWRINPDGTFDSGAPSSLFVFDPTVLVDESPGGQFGAIRRINGSVTSMTIDCSQATSQVNVYPANPFSYDSAVGSSVGRGLDGTTLVRHRAVDAPSDNPNMVDAIGTSTLDLFQYARSSFQVATTDRNVRRFVEPGDSVWVYAPLSGIKSDNRVDIGAQTVYPQKVRVHEIDWGVHEGHGVYLRRHDGVDETWLRLTPYVQFSDPASTWTVGTARGLLDAAALAGAARLGASTIVNPNFVANPNFVPTPPPVDQYNPNRVANPNSGWR
jgi:hypothetical protein